MEKDRDMTDSLIEALLRMGYLVREKHKKPAPPKEPQAYKPTLRGVTYDRSQNRLRAQMFSRRINGKRSCITLGQGAPTKAEEERLHALWLAAKKERAA